MLKELFEGTFYMTFSKKTETVVNISEKIYSGAFSLNDPVACSSCKICQSDESQRKNIVVSTQSPLSVVSVSQIVSYIQDSIGKNCDYMMANVKSVCFIEMTCSASEYVNRYESGKRMTAKTQLRNTISTFRVNPNVDAFIEGKDIKYAVFSWKDTSYPKDVNDKIERGFEVFSDIANELKRDNHELFIDGFLFKEIQYPEVLVIDN